MIGRHVLAYTDATGFGGAELSLSHLLGAASPSWRVTLVGLDRDILSRIAASRPDVDQVLLPAPRHRRDVACLREHRRLLVTLRPDLLHTNLSWPGACHLALMAGASLPGLPVVAVEHLPLTLSGTGRRLKQFTSLTLSAHVAVGNRSARELERLCGLRRGSVRSIFNGVPLPAPGRDAPPSLWPSTARPVVGAIARLHDQKGLDILLRAASAVPEATIVIIGSGEAEPELRTLAAKLDLGDRLVMVPWVDGASRYLPSMDVVAIPSRAEGFPLSLVEAMHAGRPLVTTPVGSIPDAVEDGVTGLLVPPGDVEALAVALRSLLDDPVGAASMGERARARSRTAFTDTAMAADYERLWDALTTSRAKRWTRGVMQSQR